MHSISSNQLSETRLLREPDSYMRLHGYLPTEGSFEKLADHPTAGLATGTYDESAKDCRSLKAFAAQCNAAESLGYESILVPYALGIADDPVITSSALIAHTSKLKFMPAIRPSLVSPVQLAQQITSFQKFSNNRLTLNVTFGAPGPPSHIGGVWLTKQELLDQTAEFLTVMRGAWEGPFDFEGRYFHVQGASVPRPEVLPRVFFSGSSDASLRFAAEHADVYLSLLEPIAMFSDRVERAQRVAAENGRDLPVAASVAVIARDTAEEAWAAVADMMEGVQLNPDLVKMVPGNFEQFGVYRNFGAGLAANFDGDWRQFLIGPNLWIGAMLAVGPAAGPIWVGSYDEIAERVEELQQIGVRDLLFGGVSMERTAEGATLMREKLMPLLRKRGLMGPTDIASK